MIFQPQSSKRTSERGSFLFVKGKRWKVVLNPRFPSRASAADHTLNRVQSCAGSARQNSKCASDPHATSSVPNVGRAIDGLAIMPAIIDRTQAGRRLSKNVASTSLSGRKPDRMITSRLIRHIFAKPAPTGNRASMSRVANSWLGSPPLPGSCATVRAPQRPAFSYMFDTAMSIC